MQEILHQLLRLGGVFRLHNPLRKISGADNLQRSLWTDTGNAGVVICSNQKRRLHQLLAGKFQFCKRVCKD